MKKMRAKGRTRDEPADRFAPILLKAHLFSKPVVKDPAGLYFINPGKGDAKFDQGGEGKKAKGPQGVFQGAARLPQGLGHLFQGLGQSRNGPRGHGPTDG